jgi:hypothetical protein
MNIKTMILVLAAAFVAGCGTIQEHNQVAQPTGRDLDTYIGGTIFKVSRTKDLPNAFGRADLFGGKVFAGYTELRYQGLTDDGKILLRVTEIETHSSETTMSRYGQSTGSYHGYSDGYGNVSGSLTVHNPPQGSTEILPPNTTQFAFDISKEKELVIAGVRVSFIEVKPQSLRFRLATQP